MLEVLTIPSFKNVDLRIMNLRVNVVVDRAILCAKVFCTEGKGTVKCWRLIIIKSKKPTKLGRVWR